MLLPVWRRSGTTCARGQYGGVRGRRNVAMSAKASPTAERGAHVGLRENAESDYLLAMMSKCALCGSRKGKRLCRVRLGSVCPICCGEARQPETCGDCEFYRPPVRNYGALPRHSTERMGDSTELQGISYPVEAAICSLDRERDYQMQDAQAIVILELLLDFYAFADSEDAVSAKAHELGCEKVVEAVRSKMRGFDHAVVAKVIATARFTACRRASGDRQHLDLLHHFCDPGIGPNPAGATD
jgi:hypothetical protein